MREIFLPSGEALPVLGIGTWGMGEHPGNAARETAAIQMALDLGSTGVTVSAAAAELGIGRATIYRRMARLGITIPK
jgi:transcriptional regulator of acetoin/glycerol metabolism